VWQKHFTPPSPTVRERKDQTVASRFSVILAHTPDARSADMSAGQV
jgi:hypothetical protein